MEEVRVVRTDGKWYVVDEKNRPVGDEVFDTWDTAKPVQLLNRSRIVPKIAESLKPVAKKVGRAKR